MNKTMFGAICFILAIGLVGCGSKIEQGSAKDSYNPKVMSTGSMEKSAVVKVADSLYLWQVDGKKLVGRFKMNMFGGSGPDSVRVNEGVHSIYFKKKKIENNFYIKNVSLQGKHEYLINYIIKSGMIHYWVEDLTDNKVVYGKKITKEDLAKNN